MCDLLQLSMVLKGILWSYMAFYGHITVFCGLSWPNIDLIGLVSSFLAVIDPNSFGLVSIEITIHWDSLVKISDKLLGGSLLIFHLYISVFWGFFGHEWSKKAQSRSFSYLIYLPKFPSTVAKQKIFFYRYSKRGFWKMTIFTPKMGSEYKMAHSSGPSGLNGLEFYVEVFGTYTHHLIHILSNSVIFVPDSSFEWLELVMLSLVDQQTCFKMRHSSIKIHCPAKTWIYLTPYVCTEWIFDSRPFMYNKIFLKKLLQKLVAHIFGLLLALFASKLVN